MTKTAAPSLLILGAARSGKSAYAQAQAEASGLEPCFIATAQAFDTEMEMRIAAHARARGARWTTEEIPFDLVAGLTRRAAPDRILLVDCLTLWLSNLMHRGDDIEQAGQTLAEGVARSKGPVILVTNEVGGGIVPENALARRFRDAQGRLNQRMAAVCDHVVLVSAGLPIVLKPHPRPRFEWGA